jgi:gluconokinase
MKVIIMGISGCGKTTIGKELEKVLDDYKFIEGDDYHPIENKNKMKNGIPLNDKDREIWLKNLLIDVKKETNVIVSCSLLKKSYRDFFIKDNMILIYIKVSNNSFNIIKKRIENRGGHFFNVNLLKSQFETLEEPTNANLTVDFDENINIIVKKIKDIC